MTPRKIHTDEAPRRIPGKRVSKEEASIRYRYGSVRVLRDGRIRLSPRTIAGIPELDFSAVYVWGLADGTHVENKRDYAVDARWPGNETFFVLWVNRHRVQSACFNFKLTPDEMRKAVALLRKAGGGIERWLIPGLEFTRDAFLQFPTSDDTGPKMLAVIEELLKENRDLPVAEPWKRLVREREQSKRQQASQAAKTRAPARKSESATRRSAGKTPRKRAPE